MAVKRSGSSARASPRGKNEGSTRKNPRRQTAAARPRYDFTKGVRGKYAERYATGTNIVLLEPDVAQAFPTARAVNQALRELLSERHA